MSVTFSYTDGDGVTTTVTLKGPDLANEERVRRQQEVSETVGGQLFVYQRGPEIRELHLSFPHLDDEERANLEAFFDVIGGARRWWTLTLAPTTRYVLRAGAEVDGAVVTCGTTYKAGQRVLMDSVTFRVRLLTPDVSFVEALEQHHSVQLGLRVLGRFVPENSNA